MNLSSSLANSAAYDDQFDHISYYSTTRSRVKYFSCCTHVPCNTFYIAQLAVQYRKISRSENRAIGVYLRA